MPDIETKLEEKATTPDGVIIRPARPSEAEALARLMSEAITWSRLSELGPGFVTLLHRHMIASANAVCYVAEREGEIIGYSVWSVDSSKFYREFLLRRGFMAAVILAPKIFRPQQLKTIARCLTYFPEAHPDDPQAEVLSFAVRPQVKQSGVGKAIFNALAREMETRGVKVVKVGAVEATNEGGNRFYSRLGCE
ncbi:MAG: GNAT family N-acetyltransferase, partial [Blastocatellales bacterium]